MWNREQAIAQVGLANVEAVERVHCQPTNRVGFQGSCAGDDFIEWSASIRIELQGFPLTLTVFYFTDAEDEAIAQAQGWDSVTFTPEAYDLV